MKKLLTLVMSLVMVISLAACGDKAEAPQESAETGQNVGPVEGSKADMLKGKRIAVVRNLPAGDHTQQFLDGTVSEGKALGFEVETFVTDGDDARMQEVIAQVIAQGFDGIIASHGQLSYSYDMLKPAIDAGIKVVTFDTMPHKDGNAEGELLEGVTSTAQDDAALAELSLGFMMEEFEAKGGTYPMKVLKTFMGPGIPPLDRRDVIYNQLVEDGKIETVEIIAPSDTANVRGDMTNKTSALLPKYAAGSVDAIWGIYDELAKGVLQALNDAGRTDIPMYMIDISNDDIQLMITNPEVIRSTAAVDPKLIGIVNMRLLAMKLVGEETPDYYNLNANNVKTNILNDGISMTNLDTVVDGWGNAEGEETFNLDWIKEIKK